MKNPTLLNKFLNLLNQGYTIEGGILREPYVPLKTSLIK
jgi:hypothetical protein